MGGQPMTEDLIKVEDGDIFEGTWEMLEDCFGLIDFEDLESWCSDWNYTYTITHDGGEDNGN